ncbi:MAG: helix-turn-helix domain-containing protein [Rhizobiales bacterium]|nr:helix-turn-helix domain-containing protein [Hyphomicrobiales bacterium]
MIEDPTILVQKLRVQRGWSQEQLAVLSGLSVRTIQRIERGQPASTETLKSLAAVFEVDFNTLRSPDMPAIPNVPRPEPAISEPTVGQQAVGEDEALVLLRVRKIKAFYLHLAQYVLTLAFLTIINLWTSPRYLWVGWVALGWGLGLVSHGLKAFDKVPFLNGDWERREVEKRLGRRL